jgi:hypothetical protein
MMYIMCVCVFSLKLFGFVSRDTIVQFLEMFIIFGENHFNAQVGNPWDFIGPPTICMYLARGSPLDLI